MRTVISYRKEIELLRQTVEVHSKQCTEDSEAYATTVDEHQQKFAKIFNEIHDVKQDIRKFKACSSTKKPINEIKVNGLPKKLPVTPRDAVRKIFNSLEISNLIGDVVDTREYVNKNNPETSSFVITMKSDVLANYIVNKSRKKQGLKSSELFGDNSNGLIYLNELLPPETFRLYMDLRRERKKGLWGSVKHEFGHIYVKRTEKSQVIQIDNRSDLEFI